MRLTRFGSITLPDNDAQHDFNIQARSALVELPDGSYDHDGSRVVLKPTTIRAKFLIIGQSAVDADGQAEALFRLLGAGRLPLFATMRDNNRERVTYAKMIGIQRGASVDRYDCELPLTITWQQDAPVWYDADDIAFFDSGLLFDNGLSFDGHYDEFTMYSSPYPFGLHNPGTLRSTQGTIVIVPETASSISDIRITNLTNSMSFRWSGTVAANERLDLDLLTRTVYLQSTDAFEFFTVENARQSAWMSLETGDNSLQLEGTISGTVKMYWQWSRMYL